MTLPPCISSSFSSRSNGGIGLNHSNFSQINPLRHQPQQSRLFSMPIIPQQSEQISPMRTFEPRSATPDLMQSVSNERKPEEDSSFQDTNDEGTMEDNAARMLLQLSKIVSNEISTDSGCITRTNSQDMVHRKEEAHTREELSQNLKHVYTSDQDLSNTGRSVISLSVPKSIEIHQRDWEDSFNAPTSISFLENNGIPRVVVASKPNSFSNISSQVSSNIFKNVSFERIDSNPQMRRFRTVSLASEDTVFEDRELSPLLKPLSSPLLSKDVKSYSFRFHESPQQSSRHISRLGQHSFLLDKTELDQETLRRALLGGGPGSRSLSEALAASSATAAAVITPVPDHPRPVLSFRNPNRNERNITVAKTIAEISSVIQDTVEDRKCPFPLELPPLLMNTKKSTAGESKRVMSPAAKSPALARKVAIKKNHPVQSKKKATPKKQQRQRHTGKKFSWKAYPELEEFLIDYRNEYLSYSAKNYTIEQRDYNNRLTSRLLEHAEASGYPTLFENCAFSAVRDRIRSYYKSYVQSFKRRKERQQQQERLKKLEMNYV